MFKKNTIVIDVGFNRGFGYTLAKNLHRYLSQTKTIDDCKPFYQKKNDKERLKSWR